MTEEKKHFPHKITFQYYRYINMMSINTVIIAFLTLVHCIYTVTAEQCIGSFDALRELEFKRWNNNTIPVTYVICPNTVFDMEVIKEQYQWEMNGNTNYLCGADGSSKNNCTVTGGDVHFQISYYAYGQSSKNNILISGFTFEKAYFVNGVTGMSGKHTIRDCIFRVSSM